MTKNISFRRSGDVNLHEITEAEFSAIQGEIIKHNGSYVLAEGEATGSKHLITVKNPYDLQIKKDAFGNTYFQITDIAELTHTGHGQFVESLSGYIGEKCKIIPNFPQYKIDIDGNIWIIKNNKPLKINYTYGSYATVHLTQNKRSVLCKLHRLVLETFLGKCPKGMQARHLNGNKKDNSLLNLKWGTPKENAGDKKLHNTDSSKERNGRAKLNIAEVEKIINIKKIYPTITRQKLADMFNVSNATIGDIIKGRTWVEGDHAPTFTPKKVWYKQIPEREQDHFAGSLTRRVID